MKKVMLFAVVILCMTLTLGVAQEIVYTNQATIAWDAVTTLADGSAIPVGDTIAYRVWTRGDIDVMVGETVDLQYTVTFADEGTYTVGVQTVRYSGTEEILSEINWSDANGEWTPSPFVVRFFKGVEGPRNLRIQ